MDEVARLALRKGETALNRADEAKRITQKKERTGWLSAPDLVPMIDSAGLEWKEKRGVFGMEELDGLNNKKEKERVSEGYSFQGSHDYGIQEGETLILAFECLAGGWC